MAEHHTPPGNSHPRPPATPEGPAATGFSGHNIRYPNPPDPVNPDPVTLREQWKFAIRQYSRWYSHAWGTAILAGVSFFALGWFIKGGNPLPTAHDKDRADPGSGESESKEAGV